MNSVSPPDSDDNDEAKQVRHKKRLSVLSRAREAKQRKRELEQARYLQSTSGDHNVKITNIYVYDLLFFSHIIHFSKESR